MTTEGWVKSSLYIFLRIMLEKVGGIFKTEHDRYCTSSMGNDFPHDIILPLGYTILKKTHNWHFFFAA